MAASANRDHRGPGNTAIKRLAAVTDCINAREVSSLDETELIEELSTLTTQTARLRSHMADLVAELERRRS